MRHRLLLSLCALFAAPAFAAELEIGLEIPRLEVAEYHRPYVAVWLQRPDKTHVADLAVWYGMKMKNNKGEKWLNSLRQWWQISGRHLDMPVDGVSGATRPEGEHRLTFSDDRAPFKDLPAGEYQLMVAAFHIGHRAAGSFSTQCVLLVVDDLEVQVEHPTQSIDHAGQ
ncbi:DUF2271 domain-containing protein, partial [Azotobacter chroococcum]|nr:DUF2271 domain-containing protein [Azotobacter chroococcum]